MFRFFPGNYMWSLSVMRMMASGGVFGEVAWACRDLSAAAAVEPIGDVEQWYLAFSRLAAQVEAVGRDATASAHTVTARTSFFRASLYWQWAEAFLPPGDARAVTAYAAHLNCFAEAAARFEPVVETFNVPFEGSYLSAYFVPAKSVAPGTKPPVVILSDGLDGTKEEMFYVALALSERGISCLGIDQPGQGATLRLAGLVARHDSEAAIGAVVDYLQTRGDVDPERIGLIAASMGGYYAPRAVAFEKRIKACVAWGAIYDYYACWQRRVGWVPGQPISVNLDSALGTTGKHFLAIMGVPDWASAFKKLEAFRLKGVAERITCDILIVHGEADRQTPVIEAEELFSEISSKHKELRIYDDAEGGSAHVQLDRPEPALSLICDWFSDHL
jgi:alpha-beta hydrolase superfamily lysophospholipase